MQNFLAEVGLVGDPMGPWHIVSFLLKVGDKRPDGRLGDPGENLIAAWGKWTGDPKVFLAALRKSGWVVDRRGCLCVEGWSRHGGLVLKKRRKWRTKKRRQRANVPRDVPGTSPGRPDPVPEKSRLEGEGEGEGEGEDLDRSGNGSGLMLGEINAQSEAAFGPRGFISVKWQPKLAPLLPFTGAEIESAINEAKGADGDPSGGLVASILIRYRTQKIRSVKAVPLRPKLKEVKPMKRPAWLPGDK